MKKSIILVILLIIGFELFSQKLINRDDLLKLSAMKKHGIGAGYSSGVTPEMTKHMKGKIIITSQEGHKKTLKCMINITSNKGNLEGIEEAYKKGNIDAKQKAKAMKSLKESPFSGGVIINCSDESGENVIVISGNYLENENHGSEITINDGPVGHMSMHNTFQLMPFGENGEMRINKVGNKYTFVGSTTFKSPKGGLLVVIFEGEAPIEINKNPNSTQNGPTKLNPNQEAIDAMKRKPKPGSQPPTKL